MNWTNIAREDRKLAKAADGATEALMQLRYENTVGANPKVAIREYARRVGLTEAPVRKYVRAYELRLTETHLTVEQALLRSDMSTERADVTEAIATARGVAPGTVRAHHGRHVKQVHAAAKERAVKRGTSVREEAERLAKETERGRRARATSKEQRKKATTVRFLELDTYLSAARTQLQKALAVDVDLPQEHRDLIEQTINQVRSVLALVERKFMEASEVEVDWDGELAKLTGGQV